MDFGLNQDLRYTKPPPDSPPPPTLFRKGSQIQWWQKGTPENITLTICTTWAPCTDLCTCTGFCQLRNNTSTGMIFLPVQFQWQPLTTRNVKHQHTHISQDGIVLLEDMVISPLTWWHSRGFLFRNFWSNGKTRTLTSLKFLVLAT